MRSRGGLDQVVVGRMVMYSGSILKVESIGFVDVLCARWGGEGRRNKEDPRVLTSN